jgi:hypothetical protein
LLLNPSKVPLDLGKQVGHRNTFCDLRDFRYSSSGSV